VCVMCVYLCVQALHTDDVSLLEYCLSTRNGKIIERTIDRLPTPYVIPFLTRVIDKFQSTPSRGQALITWLKEILTRHSAYLLSVPTLTKSLTGLYSVCVYVTVFFCFFSPFLFSPLSPGCVCVRVCVCVCVLFLC
jgi:hypothetical protein